MCLLVVNNMAAVVNLIPISLRGLVICWYLMKVGGDGLVSKGNGFGTIVFP